MRFLLHLRPWIQVLEIRLMVCFSHLSGSIRWKRTIRTCAAQKTFGSIVMSIQILRIPAPLLLGAEPRFQLLLVHGMGRPKENLLSQKKRGIETASNQLFWLLTNPFSGSAASTRVELAPNSLVASNRLLSLIMK